MKLQDAASGSSLNGLALGSPFYIYNSLIFYLRDRVCYIFGGAGN